MLSKTEKIVVCRLDKSDFEYLKDYTWHTDRNGYLRTQIKDKTGKHIIKTMHSLIMKPKYRESVDHINGDILDNRRKNLRICSNKENSRNRKLPKTNTSGFKGVSRVNKRWRASIKVDDKSISLGTYNTRVEAAKAYDKAALFHFGEFAMTNKKLGLFNENQ